MSGIDTGSRRFVWTWIAGTVLLFVFMVMDTMSASATEPTPAPRPIPIVTEVPVGEPVIDCESGFVTIETRTESIDFELIDGSWWSPLPAEVIGYSSQTIPVTDDECPPTDDYVPDFTPTEPATPAPLPVDDEPVDGLAITGATEVVTIGAIAAGLMILGIALGFLRRRSRH